MQRVAFVATILALCVIMLGAYVRLSDAGLGCPDWPGCYGHITPIHAYDNLEEVNKAFPERQLETGKAWKEMIHRYLASALGLLITIIFAISLRKRKSPDDPFYLPLFLFILVIFQGLLGMWTVTLKLNPTIVMGHL